MRGRGQGVLFFSFFKSFFSEVVAAFVVAFMWGFVCLFGLFGPLFLRPAKAEVGNGISGTEKRREGAKNGMVTFLNKWETSSRSPA